MAAAIESEFGQTPELIKSAGGKFEIVANGQLIFSKIKEDRFPEHSEVLSALSEISTDH